ncbi:hypothetical protein [Gracilibacillus lacisalsi]|nr:hypothetical protein [Gracilibacillus lacisalsi]
MFAVISIIMLFILLFVVDKIRHQQNRIMKQNQEIIRLLEENHNK